GAVFGLGALMFFSADARGEQPQAIKHPDFSPEEVSFFTKEVRPLLTEHCFSCHGGKDSKGRIKIRAGLQLISRRGLVIGGDNGPAIDQENPANSLLLKMVSYIDEDHEMPPTAKLSDAQLATLNKWVEMKAPWTPGDINQLQGTKEAASTTKINETTKNFWSYRPLKTPALPKVADPLWAKNPLDAFVFARLAENGLKPNPQATKEELARRAYHNITGLAPTPEQVAAFVKDESPDAWKSLVDELLESPQYGEKWARHWLDVVRYAESNGFERDSDKPHIWRYRDWVIDAYNNDKPYDQFILEQLAGDELDEVTPESMIATGFFRLMQWDDEPADRLQHRYDVLDDILRSATEGFLGMTVGCARCHDHKGDPIPQTDYYSFMAFFNGVTNHSKGGGVLQDLSKLGNPEQRKEAQKVRQNRIVDLKNRISAIEKIGVARLGKKDPQLAALLKGATVPLAEPILVADHRTRSQKWHFTTDKPADNWSEVGFRAENAKWKLGEAPFGTEVPNEKSKTEWKTNDLWLQTGFQLTAIPAGLKMTAYHDEDIEVFLNGQLLGRRGGHSKNYVEIPIDKKALGALQTGRNVVAVHVRNTGGGQFFDLKLEAVSGVPGSVDIAKLIAERGKEVFTEEQVATYRQFHNDLKKLERVVPVGKGQAMVVKEGGTNAGQLHVHVRGNANAKGEPVEPGFPKIFGDREVKIPAPKPGQRTTGRRKVLAEWMVEKHNPRTSRVAVNRIWQQHFGNGLCPSPSDFGYLGEKPTHPELLDWLATEFVRRGWSVKEMQRVIMNSMTYRMSSRGRPGALTKDPENKLLWRFNMRRLSAEEIRDNVLAAAGKLNLKMGGPSFFSKLDEAVLATSSTKGGKWGNSSPEEQNRRAVYIKIKRSLKDPMLTGFDFADTDAPCAQRFTTTVPTQALNMLNSHFLNEQAVHFAARLKQEVGEQVEARLKRALEIVTARPADPKSLAIAGEMIQKLQKDHGLNADQALERFCLVALNMNEFMFLD
ncbi:MAG: PSD1 and planctomycete cytochrome C domain-containing protein, partial [Verrucomicrobiales bacterium]|nr:PSD1 and planctomycete cytochrome C domain-containing protein [Verrucomicrobiales bacterium]